MTHGATRFTLTWALALATIASPLRAQPRATASAVILGSVGDSGLHPIAGADVGFVGTSVRVTTDSLGRFIVTHIPAGRFMLQVRQLGYQAAVSMLDVSGSDTMRLAFTLEPVVHELAPSVVSAERLSPRMQEFEMRRKSGIGTFITRADIEAANPYMTFEMLRRSITVQLVAPPRGGGLVAQSTRARCAMQVYLDGWPFVTGGERPGMPPDVTMLPRPSEIAAIEIYNGPASMPLWLLQSVDANSKRCGAILIWRVER